MSIESGSGKSRRRKRRSRLPSSADSPGRIRRSAPRRRTAIVLVAMLSAGALAGCGGQSSAGTSTSAADVAAKLAAPAQLEPPRTAPEIALRNYTGQPVRLSQFRGKAVLLTFIYDHCPDTCPLIVSKLHTALEQLGANAREVRVIAVSVDPAGDTPSTVARFLAAHEMTGRMDYLIGSQAQLAPVWRAYGVTVAGDAQARESPERRTVSHSAVVYGITARGRWLALYDALFKPTEIAHDVPLLAAG